MKVALTILLCCLGIAGSGTCRADVTASDEVAYRAAIGGDGVQHVRIEGGAYFFKPKRVIVKSNGRVELTVGVSRSLIPHSFVIQAPEAGIAATQVVSFERFSELGRQQKFTGSGKRSRPL
jgi:hypothetical protein